jgi:succinyl-diaminopimelate desuccinylase
MTPGDAAPSSTSRADTIAPAKSILELARELIRIPSRAGEDPPQPIVSAIRSWLERHDVATAALHAGGEPVAVMATIEGAHPGPTYCLNACLDTAPFGEESAWQHSPTAAHLEGGRLYGRGAADSKMAVAIFSHLAAELLPAADALQGRLIVLFDCDEHTGGFAGAKAFLAQHTDVAGVMIGYPGAKEIVVGARGFYRTIITFFGDGGHSGSRTRTGQNAVEKAAHLVDTLRTIDVPDGATSSFPISPSLSVTGIRGGGSFSTVPETCEVMIDARLTPTFDAGAARALLSRAVAEIDQLYAGPAPARLEEHETWPAYRLPRDSRVAGALMSAAERHFNPAPRVDVCGPSNIGNLLAAHGIEATCGFGVGYRNLHAPNESADIEDIPGVFRVYHDAARSLLRAESG